MLHQDPALLVAYRAGETWAFERLYNHHVEPLRRFLTGGFSFESRGRTCRYRGASAGVDIEGVIQEAFARVFAPATRAHYDGERPFQNYLFSVARNLVLREFQRRERVLATDDTEAATDLLAKRGAELGFCREETSPEHAVADDELQQVIAAFITTLTPEESRFFETRFASAQTQEATADAMGCTRARVKLLEKHLRRRLLEVLRDAGYFSDYTPRPRWTRQVALAA
ncbi:MAG: RNA polymerase sigma factor [Myxococcota bacterium]